ncbi:enoyl-CoA hydratase-related protein [Acinetobacter chinensis]|jgi:enoyl-CoA hydratase/carnithine racemase|uniref:enoyl-CoA hydratase-related protein n=1 Tax=Acinetobacter chinensis TaxID=2004650 RepID=UPI002934ADCF|nr:enoyl-CoA hydratase-related protein [Acinetobacter chinensis]WOE42704.1 enoyl-CoA hydratase-related protein [Acinetobacter chinensis]
MTLSCIQQPHQHLNANLENGILTLAINRPEAKNALYGELYLWIAKALDEADQDRDVRVVILRGADADFSAGNDMKDFMAFISQPLVGKEGDGPPFVLLKSAARLSKPLICAIRGVAIGIGVTILLHADLVYSDSTALFQIPFVSLGLSPEGASSKLLIQQAGYHKAAELLLTAQKFNSEKALAAGLINSIEDDVYGYALRQAQTLAALPLASLVQTKKMMKHNLEEIIQCVDDEAVIFMQRVKSPEMAEAVAAFMQKRKPDFAQFN